MKRATSVAERALVLAGTALTAGWCALVLWIIFSYRGGTSGTTWVARLIMVGIAGAITYAVIMVFLLGWRRAVRRPLPRGRRNSWIVRQPAWALALVFWLATSWPFFGFFVIANHGHRQGISSGIFLGCLALSIIGASSIGLMFRVMWQRQAENSNAHYGHRQA